MKVSSVSYFRSLYIVKAGCFSVNFLQTFQFKLFNHILLYNLKIFYSLFFIHDTYITLLCNVFIFIYKTNTYSSYIVKFDTVYQILITNYHWRPPSLSELTPILCNMELTHFGLEAFNYNMLK